MLPAVKDYAQAKSFLYWGVSTKLATPELDGKWIWVVGESGNNAFCRRYFAFKTLGTAVVFVRCGEISGFSWVYWDCFFLQGKQQYISCSSLVSIFSLPKHNLPSQINCCLYFFASCILVIPWVIIIRFSRPGILITLGRLACNSEMWHQGSEATEMIPLPGTYKGTCWPNGC